MQIVIHTLIDITETNALNRFYFITLKDRKDKIKTQIPNYYDLKFTFI